MNEIITLTIYIGYSILENQKWNAIKIKEFSMKSGFKVKIRKVIKDGVIIDEGYILESTQINLPIKKQVTKKVNNCRNLESKSKRK